jgi:RNA polymerase subunit RPABC4/transcription elongation factor Spt4
MQCPNCRTVISKDAVMCYACGQKIREAEVTQPETVPEEEASEDEIACPNCKTMVSTDALMCYACGANIKDALAKLEEKMESDGGDEKSGLLKKPQIFVKKIVRKKVV